MNKKLQINLMRIMIVTIFLISIFYFVLVFAEENLKADITNSAELIIKTTDEKENKLNYKFDWGETDIILHKLINTYEVEVNKTYFNETSEEYYTVIENETKYNYTIFNDIYIEEREKGWKFGANDLSLKQGETANYKYVLNSTEELILLHKEVFDENGSFLYKFPRLYNYHINPEDEWNEFRQIYDFEDICSKSYSKCEWLKNNNSIEIFFTSTGNIDPSIINVSSCQTLYIENQIYQLNQSINTTGDCIVVIGKNITFDLKGYNITRTDNVGEDYGIDVLGGGSSDYLTVENGFVYNFGRGINLGSSDYIEIKNITANNNSYGIYLNSSSNNILIDITTNNNSYGIYLRSSPNNVLTNIITNNNSYGIYLLASSNNNITNTNISNSKTRDVYLTSNSTNNIFLNATYNISKESVDANSELIRKWYYQAKVNDTAGNNVSEVKVNVYNKTNDLILTLITDEDGLTPLSSLIDYTNKGGIRIYYSNYTINISHPCYESILSHNYNITEKTNIYEDVFTLTGFYPCVILNKPKNNTILNYTDVTFNCSALDDYGLKNVSLYFKSNGTKFVTYIENYSVWKYNDSNVWPGNNWMGTTYDDSGWPSGAAYLATPQETYGVGHNTTLNMGTYAYITYYFRKNFTITDISKIINISFNIDYDDAWAVYINGNLINTSNLTCDWASHNAICTPYPHNSMIDTSRNYLLPEFPRINLNSTHLSYLVSGTNYVAVAIKQGATTSSDTAFMLNLYGYEDVSVIWHANQTKNISGLRNETTFEVNLTDNSNYEWNCEVCDIDDNCNFSKSNYTFIINTSYNLPPEIILQYPLDGSTGISINPTLNVTVIDPDGDLMNVTFYGREKNDTNFTIIAIPDTQKYVMNENTAGIFTNQTMFIKSNKSELNIIFVTHEGDIVENWNVIAEWNRANESMSILDGEVPYGVLPGNHDMKEGIAGGATTFYNTYFPVERFNNTPEWGDNFDRNDNNYYLFSAGGQDFIIFHIEFQANGTSLAKRHPVFTWINNTLEAYPNRSAIITTHEYLKTNNNLADFGDELWKNVIKTHSNVFLVLAGDEHDPGDGEGNRTDNNIAGKPVHQLLADYQAFFDTGPLYPALYNQSGLLRIMKFVPVEKKIYVYTFSPYLNQSVCNQARDGYSGNYTWNSDVTIRPAIGCYKNDTQAEFTLNYEPFNYLGQDLNVVSGKNATFMWRDRKVSTTYEWYIEVVDSGGAKNTSDVWSFTTTSPPP